jgi:purine-nucleoside phosphorylase
LLEELNAATEAVAQRAAELDVAIVLGSGLGPYADSLQSPVVIPYAEIPHMPRSSVSGHPGNLVIGMQGTKRVGAMQGRFHLYEGYSPAEVVFGARLLGRLGARTLIVTNAAGAVSPDLVPGDLMAITDHINRTGRSSLAGEHEPSLGPRFVDMSAAYEPGLIELATMAATRQGFALKQGVYACSLGPEYETPAEIRMLAALGVDAVGMSTVHEVVAARQMGLQVLGLSCITNPAAGLGRESLSHEDVKRVAERSGPRFEALLSAIVETL